MNEDNARLSPPVVLIVEDNMIIAMDAGAMFRELGATDVHLAATPEEAEKILGEHHVDFVLLDVKLGSVTSYGMAEALLERGIMFAFASGYGDDEHAPESVRHRTTLAKPYFLDSVRRLLIELQGKTTFLTEKKERALHSLLLYQGGVTDWGVGAPVSKSSNRGGHL